MLCTQKGSPGRTTSLKFFNVKDHMVRRPVLAQETSKTHKIEHSEDILAQIRRSNAVLLGTIKALETQLQAKGLLSGFDGSFYPLWFLSEQERNVFLWRKGCSLIEASDFEFWVDIHGLIEKRKRQLDNAIQPHPFISPDWEGDPIDSTKEKELGYLNQLSEVFSRIEEYANALSCATSEALDSYTPSQIPVLLPSSSNPNR